MDGKNTKVYTKKDKLVLSSKFSMGKEKFTVELEYSVEEFDELIKKMVKEKLKFESKK